MSDIKKKPVGRPAVNATPLTVRMPPDLLGQLDTYIAEDHPGMSRPEAMRLIIQMYLFVRQQRAAEIEAGIDPDGDGTDLLPVRR